MEHEKSRISHSLHYIFCTFLTSQFCGTLSLIVLQAYQ